MTAATLSTPDIAEVITSAVHTWMFGTPQHPDLGTHIAITLTATYRIEPKRKTRAA